MTARYSKLIKIVIIILYFSTISFYLNFVLFLKQELSIAKSTYEVGGFSTLDLGCSIALFKKE